MLIYTLPCFQVRLLVCAWLCAYVRVLMRGFCTLMTVFVSHVHRESVFSHTCTHTGITREAAKQVVRIAARVRRVGKQILQVGVFEVALYSGFCVYNGARETLLGILTLENFLLDSTSANAMQERVKSSKKRGKI